ncbi:MAG: TFIIB-type zinc ribbon-containing protein [Archaeoglobales archaeon]|nr:MAG: TFIIB-type zinc ribbon-containing protein [Archaeoglobales archaeon]
MRIFVCPMCGSTDVELDAGGYTGKYVCKNCGYVGSFVVEMSEDEYREFKDSGDIEKFIKRKGNS